MPRLHGSILFGQKLMYELLKIVVYLVISRYLTRFTGFPPPALLGTYCPSFLLHTNLSRLDHSKQQSYSVSLFRNLERWIRGEVSNSYSVNLESADSATPTNAEPRWTRWVRDFDSCYYERYGVWYSVREFTVRCSFHITLDARIQSSNIKLFKRYRTNREI